MSVPVRLTLSGSAAAHARYAREVGIDGFEITPVLRSQFYRRLLASAWSLRSEGLGDFTVEGFNLGAFVDELYDPSPDEERLLDGLVVSYHESIRSDGDDSLIGRQFPPKDVSRLHLRKIQNRYGPRSITLLPEDNYTYPEEKVADFRRRTVQISPKLFKSWDLNEESSVAGMVSSLKAHGLSGQEDGFTLDLAHILYPPEDEQKFNNPAELVKRLAVDGLIKSIHLAVNRTDVTGVWTPNGKATRYARKAFATSADLASQTPEGELLSIVAKEWLTNAVYKDSERIIVLEDGPWRIGGFGRTRRIHRAIINTVKTLVARAAASEN